ncbi:DNA cytosine methyltransferase [Vibrio sp. 11986-1-5]|uniref:DNA cytosine methyltransferase n=1 Tax=Vibrio sp. 11986-1-5 TaxID=2211215 RepID=UPI001C63D2C4|nr:DNA (cytosine-5-)-methyltransferase [Vibrio sp. 11986-1-5]
MGSISDKYEFSSLHNKKMTFIDLFAGLGGFHTGFAKNGHECVFACEIEPALRELYEQNYGIVPHSDITKAVEEEIPPHDVICAGFPCQPFSLAGKKKGAECPESGRLIDHVIRIANYHCPKFIVLENVPNVITIADGSFWKHLTESFENIGYVLYHKVISPVDIGIPQNRKRIFIVAVRHDLDVGDFEWPEVNNSKSDSLLDILDNNLEHKKLEQKKVELLENWQSLLSKLNISRLVSTSIVAPEFGATYPFDFSNLTLKELKKYKGAYGTDLSECKTWKEVLELLPSYTRKNKSVSGWLVQSVEYSRKLYLENKNVCDKWTANNNKEFNSWQILEWRGEHDNLDVYKHLVQFRASGIRVLKPYIAPSLISMTPTQIPVIPKYNRYMSPLEAAKLQNLHELPNLPSTMVKSFKALGNAVNAKVVELISKNLNIKYAI